jgi:hypothetical protein
MLLAGLSALSLASVAQAGATHLTIATASPVPRHVQLGLNKSMIVDLPANAREVIVSQPTIASATMRSQRRAIIAGTGAGDTNMFFIDDQGRQIATLDVSVAQDDSSLATTLATVLPGSNIHVQGFGQRLVLSGTALSQDDVSKATAIAAQFAGGADNVTSVVTVSGPQQVNLKVTVAEVQRSAVRQLGLDLAGALTIGQLTTGIVNYSSLGAASGVVSGTGQAISSPGLPTGVPVATGNSIAAGFSIPGLSLAATLHALEQRNLLRTLDEPTLTAMSGQPAELDAGGQIPLLNPPDQNGQISYTYKQIGARPCRSAGCSRTRCASRSARCPASAISRSSGRCSGRATSSMTRPSSSSWSRPISPARARRRRCRPTAWWRRATRRRPSSDACRSFMASAIRGGMVAPTRDRSASRWNKDGPEADALRGFKSARFRPECVSEPRWPGASQGEPHSSQSRSRVLGINLP